MRKIGGIVLDILEVIIIIYVIFITTCLLCKNKYGFTEINNTTYVSITDEVSDYLKDTKVNDMLVIEKKSYKNINEGDTIYYYDTEYQSYVIKTGTVSKKDGNNKYAVYTLDTKQQISSDRVLGEYKKTYKGIGKIYNILMSRFGFLFLVILPVFMVFVYQVYNIIVLLKFKDEE